MQDYICNNCKTHVDNPHRENASSEKYGIDEVLSCPYCGSDSLTEAVKCRECDDYMAITETDRYHYFNFSNSYGEWYYGVICNNCLAQRLEEVLNGG